MTHLEASCIANHFVRSFIITTETNGYAYPIVFVAKKDKMIKTQINHSHVQDQSYATMTMLDMEVHLQVYIIRIETATDEENIIPISKLATNADPDMIGVMSSCLFQLYNQPSSVAKAKILNDPEAAKVLTGYYYLKEDNQSREIDIPYIPCGSYESNEILPAYSGWYIPERVKRNRNPFC